MKNKNWQLNKELEKLFESFEDRRELALRQKLINIHGVDWVAQRLRIDKKFYGEKENKIIS